MRFAKERGKGWESFTYAEIDKFYGDGGYADFGFNKLISGGWILEITPKVYQFTEDFIARCYRSATRP